MKESFETRPEASEQEDNFEELFTLLDTDNRRAVGRAVKAFKEELAHVPKVGKTLERQKGSGQEEFVIPLTSHEQKARLQEILYDLSIFPWSENGLLIIDHSKDIQKLRAAGFIIEKPQEPKIVHEPSAPNERYDFPLPKIEGVRIFPTKEQRTKKQVEEVNEPEMPKEEGIDTDMANIVARFDQGLIDEEAPEFKKAFGSLPTLTLFPRQYIWKGNEVVHARSGKSVSEEELETLHTQARKNDEKAVETLVRIHTGIVLTKLAEVKNRWPQSNADDMFQEGLIGLVKAIKTHDPEKGAFTTHAFINVESAMRNYIQTHELGPVRLPAHTSHERRAYHKSVEAVAKEHPERAPTDQEVLEKLSTKLPGMSSFGHLEKFKRAYLINALFDPMDDEEDVDPTMVDLLGNPRMANSSEKEITEADITKIYEILSTLPPRYQFAIRLCFSLIDGPPITPEQMKDMASESGIHSKKSSDIISRVKAYDSTNFDPFEYRNRSNIEKLLLVIAGKVPKESLDPIVSEGLTLSEAGVVMGVSQERLRQMVNRGIRELRHPSRNKILMSLLS